MPPAKSAGKHVALLRRGVLLLIAGGFGCSSAAEPWLGSTLPIVPDGYTAADPVDRPAESADELFAWAQQAAQSGAAADAFRLATEALLADPDHPEARRVLSYERSDGQWMTPYQARQHRRGYRWDGRFGWVRADELSRYEAGERRVGRRWVDAATADRARSDILDGWAVRTDRFVVQSNHSIQAATRLAAELEALHQAWRNAFAGYLYSESDLRDLFFEGQRPARPARPMRVFHHRDKAGYTAHLRRRQPRIAETLGIYFDDAREAHFYHSGAEADASLLRATLYHEAAHQMFAENGPGRVGAGRDTNFWLVEGVACYFEMLSPVDGRAGFTLCHPAQGRLPSAVAKGPVMPLERLAGLGMTDLQRVEDLPGAYAQAAGVVTMLMHGEQADRAALVDTLREVYSRSDRPTELAEQTGRSWRTLEEQYLAFLANLSP
ncbi:hypothetical protein [Botrimarina sp.]|uniref:hypothetical protein n=1 Tax=Botrimarina sp. TaxID=2795802 RepID=UPI0032EE0963